MKSVKCPGCSSNLTYNLEDEILKCQHCGSVCTVIEAKITDKQFIEERFKFINEAVCPNCGANIISDMNTISTKCVYCDGSLIYDKKVNKVGKPKKILLFEAQLEEAKGKLKSFLKKEKIKNADKIVNKLKAIYLPFWSYNFKATFESNSFDGSSFYTREYNNILADASAKIPDVLTDKFDDDFDFTKLQDFEISMIAGQLAEEFDVTARQIYKRVSEKIGNKTKHEMKNNNIITNIVHEKEYILLPFFYVTFYENGMFESYQILIDGQNLHIKMHKTIKPAIKEKECDMGLPPIELLVRVIFATAVFTLLFLFLPLLFCSWLNWLGSLDEIFFADFAVQLITCTTLIIIGIIIFEVKFAQTYIRLLREYLKWNNDEKRGKK